MSCACDFIFEELTGYEDNMHTHILLVCECWYLSLLCLHTLCLQALLCMFSVLHLGPLFEVELLVQEKESIVIVCRLHLSLLEGTFYSGTVIHIFSIDL